MLVHHMPAPVVFPGKRFPSRVPRTAWIGAVVCLRFEMYVVHVSFKMCLGTEPSVTSVVGTGVLAIVVPPMMV
jgi:hypothetical protein